MQFEACGLRGIIIFLKNLSIQLNRKCSCHIPNPASSYNGTWQERVVGKTTWTASYETVISVLVPGHSAGTHGDKYESLQSLK